MDKEQAEVFPDKKEITDNIGVNPEVAAKLAQDKMYPEQMPQEEAENDEDALRKAREKIETS